jgi:ubiquinol-cytochrome c reductase cytochrome c subunit
MRSLSAKLALVMLLAAGPGLPGANSAAAADAEKGKLAFAKSGCWQCHGFAGQGSVATSGGRVIARTQLPLDAFKAFVRTTNGAMPPYRREVLSDDDLDNIYAYLQSLPPSKTASDIPLLDSGRTQ